MDSGTVQRSNEALPCKNRRPTKHRVAPEHAVDTVFDVGPPNPVVVNVLGTCYARRHIAIMVPMPDRGGSRPSTAYAKCSLRLYQSSSVIFSAQPYTKRELDGVSLVC